MRWVLALLLANFLAAQVAAQEATPEWLARERLPDWVQVVVAEPSFGQYYTFDLRMNPFFVAGDFDRDGARDAAIWIRNRATNESGIAMIRRAGPRLNVIGAGTDLLQTGAKDFRRMDIWRVVPADEQPKGKRRSGDLLYIEKSESGSGLISWDGSRYRWTQLAD